MIYYRPDRRMKEEPNASISRPLGSAVRTPRKVELERLAPRITTAAGVKLTLASRRYLDFADFSAGKLMYLSDIEPASAKVDAACRSAAIGNTAPPNTANRVATNSAFGGPLIAVMKASGDAATAASARTRTFNKGLALRSRTEIVYRLPAGFKRFIAIAGIDPATSATRQRAAVNLRRRPRAARNRNRRRPAAPTDSTRNCRR